MASLATPMSIRVAATLRLADLIGDTGATAAQLAEATATAPMALTRVLDHLVTIGVLEFVEDRYGLTALAGPLRADHDTHLLDQLDIDSAIGRATLAFVDLLDVVKTSTAAYPRRYGRDFWADLADRPALRQSFDARMERRFDVRAPEMARRFDWSRFGTIVDVGGGVGTVLRAIVEEHPTVTGQVVDLEPTVTRAAEAFAAAGLDHRVTTVAGSFFDPLPRGAAAYLLCDILHDWDDEHARVILSRCAEAAGEHGRVLVIEMLREHDVNTMYDLCMLVFFGGGERTIEELNEMARPFGLTAVSKTPVAVDRTLVEFTATTTG